MGTHGRSRGAYALPLAWLIAACSTGQPGSPGLAANTFGEGEIPMADDGGEDDFGTKTGLPPDSATSTSGGEGSGTSIDDDTKGDPDTDPVVPETTGDDGSSSSGGGEESSSGEPPVEPGDEPMYAACSSNADCQSGYCLTIEDEYNNELGRWCSADCDNPVFDCDEPIGSSATPICVTTEEGGGACWLTCTGGEACPAGLQCYAGPEEDWCLP